MRILLYAAPLALAGCGLTMQAKQQQTVEIYRSAAEECDRIYPNQTKKPVTLRVICMNRALDRIAATAPRDIDIIRLLQAERLVAAERYDKGLTTEAEYVATIARLDSNTTTAAGVRDRDQQQTIAAQTAASAAMMAQGAATIAASRPTPVAPPPPPPMPRDVRCTTYGNVTNCQQW